MRAWLARGLATGILVLAAVPAFAQSDWGVGVTPNNDVYFCDARRDQVWKLDTLGTLSVAIPNVHCRALVVGPDGAVYGESVDAGSRVDVSSQQFRGSALGIWRMDATGVRTWVEPPTPTPDLAVWVVRDAFGQSFNWAGAIPHSPHSEIVRRTVSNLMVLVAGGLWGQRDGTGDGAQFGRVSGLALAPDGSLVVVDSGNVRRVSQTGLVTTESRGTVSNVPSGLLNTLGLWDHTIGVATDATGAAIVVDDPAHRVVRIDRGGHATEIWRAGGLANRLTGSRWGWRPTGVAVLPSGYYVMEDWPLPEMLADLVGVPRILQIHPDGSSQVVVSVSSWLVRAVVLLMIVIALSWMAARRTRA